MSKGNPGNSDMVVFFYLNCVSNIACSNLVETVAETTKVLFWDFYNNWKK